VTQHSTWMPSSQFWCTRYERCRYSTAHLRDAARLPCSTGWRQLQLQLPYTHAHPAVLAAAAGAATGRPPQLHGRRLRCRRHLTAYVRATAATERRLARRVWFISSVLWLRGGMLSHLFRPYALLSDERGGSACVVG
jgi:hypothetical protein